MIYKAVEVIWIFLAGRTDGTEIEGSIRGPRGPKKINLDRLKSPKLLDPSLTKQPGEIVTTA